MELGCNRVQIMTRGLELSTSRNTHTLTSGFKLTSNYNTPESLHVQAHTVKCSNNTYALCQATYLDQPVEAFYDWEQNLFVSLAQPEPSDLLVAGYEPAVGMP